MRLSKIEFWAMNNPIRRWVQKNIEFNLFKKHLEKHNINLTGKAILDVGCGSGYSTQLISKEFNPSLLIAFDYMIEQIKLAKKRSIKANFFVGDVAKLELPSNSFDAVFIFGILHHVPEWKKALHEIANVLKSKGFLLVEEISKPALNLAYHFGFKHPEESRFEWQEFEKALNIAEFKILEKRKILRNKTFKSFLCVKL